MRGTVTGYSSSTGVRLTVWRRWKSWEDEELRTEVEARRVWLRLFRGMSDRITGYVIAALPELDAQRRSYL